VVASHLEFSGSNSCLENRTKRSWQKHGRVQAGNPNAGDGCRICENIPELGSSWSLEPLCWAIRLRSRRTRSSITGSKAVSFTGSNEGASVCTKKSPGAVPKVQCEMAGKNVVILEDADLDLAVESTAQGAFGSSRARCTATSRAVVVNDMPTSR